MSRNPRILFLASDIAGVGGIQRFNRNLLEALLLLNGRVDVISLMDSTAQFGVTAPKGQFDWRAYRGSKVGWSLRLIRTLLTRRYDQIIVGHLHQAPLVMAMALCTGQRKPLSLITHGVEIWDRLNGLKKLAVQLMPRVLCVSRYTRDSILSQAKVAAENLHVFPNTLSSDLTPEPSTTRSGRFRVLAVSRLDKTERAKGVDDLVRAFAHPSLSQSELVIVGGGDDLDYYQSIADENCVRDRVVLTGRLTDDELRAAYRSADCFALPSAKEGFGIVFLEAMHFGLPVIAAAEKGALDVVRDDENGLLVPYGAPDALAEALVRLKQDPDLCARLGDAGRTAVHDGGCFSFSAFVDRTRAVFT